MHGFRAPPQVHRRVNWQSCCRAPSHSRLNRGWITWWHPSRNDVQRISRSGSYARPTVVKTKEKVHDKSGEDPGQQQAGQASGSATELLQSAIHSLDLFESTEYPTGEEEQADNLDAEAGAAGDATAQAAATVGKAIYEVLRVDHTGKVRKVYVRRRDLLKTYGLQPRDLRRIDPTVPFTKTSPSITIKDSVLLLCLGGVRAVVTADTATIFDPPKPTTKKFLEIVVPRLQAAAGAKIMEQLQMEHRERIPGDGNPDNPPPFELEVLEAALMVATGYLDAELLNVTRRMSLVLQKLPRDVTPVNLEELRRIKQALIELESKGDSLRHMLEEIMDDEDELREINLSSRPEREERRRRREMERLEREVERAREEKERGEEEDWLPKDVPQRQPRSSTRIPPTPGPNGQPSSNGVYAPPAAVLPAGPGWTPPANWSGKRSTRAAVPTTDGRQREGRQRLSSQKDARQDSAEDSTDWSRRELDADEELVEAQEALEEVLEQEKEEKEIEEVDDLLEYYLQRASTTQSEAERLLAGARDLEESIAVSLSARRFELNRLELTLSIASFAAALGAMIAGIFGMNMRSTLESSIFSFWGVSLLIVLGCVYVFYGVLRYTQAKRIL